MKSQGIKRVLFLGVIIVSFQATAQKKDPTPEFESLKLNSSPAYILLGVEPENIQRPSSPTQFIGGIQNAVINQKLRPNLAIEFSPYFWKNPKKDSARFEPEKYLLPEKNLFKNIWQSLSISLGTSESDTIVFGKLDPGTGIGAGLRFTLVEGRPQGENMERLLTWNRLTHKHVIISDIAGRIRAKDDDVKNEDIIQSVISNYFSGIGNRKSIYNLAGLYNTAELIAEIRNDISQVQHLADTSFIRGLDKIADSLNQQEKRLLARINRTKMPFAKTGFILEFAAGSAFIIQNNEWKQGRHAKTAIWLTPSYRWQLNNDEDDGELISLFDLAAVIRMTFNNKNDSVDMANYFDAGLKLQYTRNRWSLSAEGVYRRASNLPEGFSKKYTYRFITSLDYKFNSTLTFKLSFGSNFDGNTATYTEPKKMFAVGGLNVGIFKPSGNKN